MAKSRDFINNAKALAPAQLVVRARELAGQIAKTRLEIRAGKTKNLRQVFGMRKQLAVIKMLLNK